MRKTLAAFAVIATLCLSGSAAADWTCISGCLPAPDPAPVHQGGWCLHCA
jgi:hypothetical protein